MEALFYFFYSLVTSDQNYSSNEESAFLEENVFLYSLIVILFLSLIMCFVYYYVLNTWKSKMNFNKPRNWFTILIINFLISGSVFYTLIGSFVYHAPAPIEFPGWVFIGLSCVYSTILFCFWSLIIKWKSHAKFSPIKFPNSNKIRKN